MAHMLGAALLATASPLALAAARLTGQASLGDAACWADAPGFHFDACCVQQLPDCWEGSFTFERCCGAAARRFTELLGDPSCWRALPGEDRLAYYSYEQCCLTQADLDCWVGDLSPARCCGRAASALPPDWAAGDERCSEGLAEPTLAAWGGDPFTSFSVQDWSFGRLVTVTALLLFTLPYLPDAEVPAFRGEFGLAVESGRGLPVPLSQPLEISSRGGAAVVLRAPVSAEALSLSMQMLSWSGEGALLYATPLGCNVSTAPVEVAVVYCRPAAGAGPVDPSPVLQLMSDMFGWRVLLRRAATVGGCFATLGGLLKDLAASDRLGTVATVVLSPLLHDWHLQRHGLRLRDAAALFAHYHEDVLSVLGMPTVDGDGRWSWPLRRIRRQYWKLVYGSYPTGSARHLRWGPGNRYCHGGDAVSGSRIYRSSVLRQLLEGVEPQPGAAWLAALDLEALRLGQGPRTFLCVHAALPEEDYLPRVELTAALAERYEVEAAVFHPSTGLQVNCAWSSRGLHFVNDVIRDQFVVAPWCFRRVLQNAWVKLGTWWLNASSSNYIVASDGTGLAIFRNLQELIPWDTDVDVRLFAELEPTLQLAELKDPSSQAVAELQALGFVAGHFMDYSSKGAGFHAALQYSEHLGAGPAPVVADLDVVVQGYMPRARFPFAVKLAGVPVRLSQDLTDVFVAKYAPPWKRSKDNEELACRDGGHNACVPDCTPPGDFEVQTLECEFPDRFVELDVFSAG